MAVHVACNRIGQRAPLVGRGDGQGGAPGRENPSSPTKRAPKQPHAAARQEPDLAYGEAAGLKRGRVRPPRELVYAADASPGSRGTIIAAIFIRCPAQRTLLTFGLFKTPHRIRRSSSNPSMRADFGNWSGEL